MLEPTFCYQLYIVLLSFCFNAANPDRFLWPWYSYARVTRDFVIKKGQKDSERLLYISNRKIFNTNRTRNASKFR